MTRRSTTDPQRTSMIRKVFSEMINELPPPGDEPQPATVEPAGERPSRARSTGRAVVLAAAGVVLVGGLVFVAARRGEEVATVAPTPSGTTDSSQPAGLAPNVTGPSSTDGPSDGIGTVDIDAVPSISQPLALTEYLYQVHNAVRNEVGDDVFGGSVVNSPDTDDATLVIYGTEPEVLSDALDRLATGARDRFSVVESRYSVDELERMRAEAEERLEAAGIEALVLTTWGQDALDIHLTTKDGAPDPELELAAKAAIGDIPAVLHSIRWLHTVLDD